MERLRQLRTLLKRTLIELNLFKLYPSDDRFVRHQRTATWLYILIILAACTILTLYSSLSLETYQGTLKSPTEFQFNDLQLLYSTSLQCACSSASIPYHVFLTIEPYYHQICSSYFLSKAWLSWLDYISSVSTINQDFTVGASSHFNMLVILCTQAENTITDALQQFSQQTYVTAQVVPKQLFEPQAAAFINDWKVATINDYVRTFRLVIAIQYGCHLGTVYSNFVPNISDSGKFELDLYQSYDNNCSCLLSASCNSVMGLYHFYDVNGGYTSRVFVVPHFYTGCFKVQALLASTLECFYSETCINRLFSNIPAGPPATPYVLLNANISQANETIESIVKQLFVANWSSNISFSAYYQYCAPYSCTFDYTRRRNILTVVTTIIGVLGGLTTGLKIAFLILLRIIVKMRADRSFLMYLRSTKIWFLALCNQEHITRRLNIVLLVTTLITLYLSSSIPLQIQNEQVFKPSFQTYQDLFLQYPTTLQCACSEISIKYEKFMNLTVRRQHQVCLSDFVSDRIIQTLFVPKNLSNYSPYRFEKIAISHFQLLAILCQLTTQHLSDAISKFASKNFNGSQFFSFAVFNNQTQTIIDQFQMATINSFLNTIQLIRDMTSDNMLISVLETNWKWNDPIDDGGFYLFGPMARTQSVVYDTCDCALSSKCVQPGIVSNNLTLPGLMVGCYPLESLLKSTLECLYSASCFYLLQTAYEQFTPLDPYTPSRYKINSSVESILSQLMIEEWSSNAFFENYYVECAPSSCSYSYFKHRPAIDVITMLLGLYGGLVIIMNVVIIILVALWKEIINHRRPTRIETINN